MKLCKDCWWFHPQEAGKAALCGHPTSVHPAGTSLITGEPILGHQYTCADMRFFLAWGGFCGSEGTHWAPKQPPEPVGFVHDDPSPRTGGAMEKVEDRLDKLEGGAP
jgi:hypothetical protein